MNQQRERGPVYGTFDAIDLSTVARHLRDQRNGLQLWRAPGKPRLRLLVSLRTLEDEVGP